MEVKCAVSSHRLREEDLKSAVTCAVSAGAEHVYSGGHNRDVYVLC